MIMARSWKLASQAVPRCLPHWKVAFLGLWTHGQVACAGVPMDNQRHQDLSAAFCWPLEGLGTMAEVLEARAPGISPLPRLGKQRLQPQMAFKRSLTLGKPGDAQWHQGLSADFSQPSGWA